MKSEYQSYSLEELEDARRHIDAVRHPEQLRAIEREIRRRENGVKEATPSPQCRSCFAVLEPGTVSPLLTRPIYLAGYIGQICFVLFGALLVGLFSMSVIFGLLVVVVVGIPILLRYMLTPVDGYVCKRCGAQYAAWQIEN